MWRRRSNKFARFLKCRLAFRCSFEMSECRCCFSTAAFTPTRGHTHTHTHTHAHACRHYHACTHSYTPTLTLADTNTHVHTHTHACSHVQTLTCVHTHTGSYNHTQGKLAAFCPWTHGPHSAPVPKPRLTNQAPLLPPNPRGQEAEPICQEWRERGLLQTPRGWVGGTAPR